jgi:hypothetical protein
VGRQLGPWLVGAGLLLTAVGGLAWAGWFSWIGRLSGDLRITSGGTRIYIYVPITSMLLASLVLTPLLASVEHVGGPVGQATTAARARTVGSAPFRSCYGLTGCSWAANRELSVR